MTDASNGSCTGATGGTQVTAGSGTGTYTASITGLTANSYYCYRSYATNSAGTAYGAWTSFQTAPTAPTSIHIASNNSTTTLAKSGDTVTITATVSSGTTVTGTIGGKATSTNTVSSTTATLTRVLDGTETGGAGLDFTLVSTNSSGATSAATVTKANIVDGSAVQTDFTAPSAPGTPDLTAATDTGVSNTDNITTNTTPAFTISCETGATVTLYDNITSVGTGTCASSTVTITSSTLSVGTHASMNAKQTDPAGNVSTASGNLSITIDTTAPTVSSVAVQTGLTVNITFSKAMGSGVTTASNYTLSGTGQGNLTSHPNTVALVSGNTYILTWNGGEMLNGGNITITVANAQDVAGNSIGSPNSGTHTGGAIATIPILAEVTSVPNPTANATPSYTFSSTAVGNITYGGDCISSTSVAAATNNPVTLTNLTGGALSDGTHSNCTIKVTDAGGNQSNTITVSLFVVDTTAPSSVSITTPATGTYNASNLPSLTFSCSDATTSCDSSTCQWTVDNWTHSYTCSTWPANFAEGNSLSLKVREKDSLGNGPTNSSAVAITYDTTAPTGSITLGGGATYWTTNTSPTIVLTTNDAAQYQLCLNSATAGNDCSSVARNWTTYTANPTVYDFASQDLKTLYVQFEDVAGNISATYSGSITIDTVAPNSATLLGWSQSSPYNSTPVTASWTKSNSSDLADQKIQFYSDATCTNASGSLIDLSSNSLQTRAFTGVNGSTYTYKITSIDTATNSTVSACSSSMVIDTTLPVLNEVTAVTTPATNKTPSYTFSSTKAGNISYAGDCASSTATAISGNNTIIFNTLADKTYTNCTIQVTDVAGNQSLALNVASFTVDTIAPTVGVSGAPASWTNANQTATVSCSDGAGSGCNLATYAIKTYSSNPTTCSTTYADYTLTSPQTISSHSWICSAAKDNAGNVSFSTPVEFKVDKTAPVISFFTMPNQSNSRTVSIGSFSAGDTGDSNISGYLVNESATTPQLNDTGWSLTPQTSYTFSANDATKTAYAWVKDNAGNISSALTAEVLVDTTAPVTGSDASSAWSAINETVTLSPTDTGGSGVAYTYYCVYTAGGTVCDPTTKTNSGTSASVACTAGNTCLQYVKYYSVDNLGNAETVKTSNLVQIDMQAPTIIASGTSGGNEYDFGSSWTNSNVVVSLICSDGNGSQCSSILYCTGSSSCVPGVSGTDYGTYLTSLTISVSGTSYVRYASYDNVSNSETIKTQTINIDKAGPSVSAGSDQVKNGQFTQVGTVTQASSPIVSEQWTADKPANITFGSATATSTTISANADGNYVIKLTATDSAGNSNFATFNLTWDTVAPTLTEVTAVSNPTNLATPSYTFNTTEAGTITYAGDCSSSTASATLESNTIILANSSGGTLSVGTHSNCTIKVTDAAGNQSLALSVASFVVDTIPPTTTDNSDTNWHSGNQTIALSPTDSGSGIAHTYYCVDTDKTCNPTTSGTNVNVTCATGTVCQQYVSYYSVDNAGEIEDVKYSNLVKIDNSSPVTTADAGTYAFGNWSSSDVSVDLSCDDNSGSGCASTLYCISDNSTSCTTSFSAYQNEPILFDTNGTYYLKYYSVDSVGNQESTITATIKVDETGTGMSPGGSITTFENSIFTESPSVNAGPSGVASEQWTKISGSGTVVFGSPTSATTTVSLPTDGTADGNYIIRFTVVNNAGTSIQTNSKFIWDTIAPITTADAGAYSFGAWTNKNVTVNLSNVTETGSGLSATYYCVGSSSCVNWSVYSAPIPVSSSGTIRYYSVDNAGNAEAIKSQAIKIDTVDPSTSDNFTNSGVWISSNPTIALTQNDAAPSSGFAWTKYCEDTNPSNPCSPSGGTDYVSPVLISTEGTSYFRYASADNAGNIQPTVSLKVMIDTTPQVTQVKINSVDVSSSPNALANITITNEGHFDYEYTYDWCITSDASATCDHSNEGSKKIIAGQDFNPTLSLAEATPGTYYFKVIVYYNGKLSHYDGLSSSASLSFTVTAPQVITPANNGGNSGGGGGSGISGGTVTPVATIPVTPVTQTTKCYESPKADLHNGCKVNLVDFSILAYWFNRPSPSAVADLNGDGKVNLTDFSILAYYWHK